MTSDEIIKCLDFAYKVTQRTKDYYSKRNQYASTEKMIFDCFIGKLAELTVKEHLESKGYQVSEVDFDLGFNSEMYTDLIVNLVDKQINVHVKTCRHDSPVSRSWLIEEREIASLGENDYFALCEFVSINDTLVLKIIAANEIQFRDPIHNLPSKKAIYLKDINA
jgi:hypothetical protein